jgi:hypothetical protein
VAQFVMPEQLLQLVAPAGEKVPAAQLWQDTALLAPTVVEKVIAAHAVQVAELVAPTVVE